MEGASRLNHYVNILTGAWVQVAGTVIAAVGETAILKGEQRGFRLVSIGNGFEAAGNGIQGTASLRVFDGTEGERLRIAGDWIQGGGNAANVVAAELQLAGEEEAGLILDVKGDVIQAAGAGLEAYGATLLEGPYIELLISGNTIQALGCIIEGIGEVLIIKGDEEKGLPVTTFGSYAQVAGALMAAVALTKRYEEEGLLVEEKRAYPFNQGDGTIWEKMRSAETTKSHGRRMGDNGCLKKTGNTS